MCSTRRLLSLLALCCVVLTVFGEASNWAKLKEKHRYRNLTRQRMTKVIDQHDETLFNRLLSNILIERTPGSSGSATVRDYIVNQLSTLGWTVELDSFVDVIPNAERMRFVNVMATQNLNARRWLTLVCHYDSKTLTGKVFLGATDSAVPCAMMLHLAHKLNDKLALKTDNDISLQLLFLDGEEAFVRWDEKDSLYGARHLAQRWSNETYPAGNTDGTTTLDRIDIFLLLDLIGAKGPKFHNWFNATTRHFQRIAETERTMKNLQQDLARNGDETVLLIPYEGHYFSSSMYHEESSIQDDHIPFLSRDVPIIHMISVPFPGVWHTVDDNRENLDFDTIQNLNAILRVYVTEYLHLPV